jgi:hypothetical protein
MASRLDDRVAQAMRISGLTFRFPFCDRDTDQFIRQLPPDFLLTTDARNKKSMAQSMLSMQ